MGLPEGQPRFCWVYLMVGFLPLPNPTFLPFLSQVSISDKHLTPQTQSQYLLLGNPAYDIMIFSPLFCSCNELYFSLILSQSCMCVINSNLSLPSIFFIHWWISFVVHYFIFLSSIIMCEIDLTFLICTELLLCHRGFC